MPAQIYKRLHQRGYLIYRPPPLDFAGDDAKRRLSFLTGIPQYNEKAIYGSSCGGIYPLLEDIIDAGMDAVNPVQITCKDMEPQKLKADFGRDITLWGGGCDTREILPTGTPQEVYDHVCRNLDVMFKDGGFVFQQVHNILGNVPPQNIAAMFKAVRDFA